MAGTWHHKNTQNKFPGSSEWPFRGCWWPPCGLSKGHLEEAGQKSTGIKVTGSCFFFCRGSRLVQEIKRNCLMFLRQEVKESPKWYLIVKGSMFWRLNLQMSNKLQGRMFVHSSRIHGTNRYISLSLWLMFYGFSCKQIHTLRPLDRGTAPWRGFRGIRGTRNPSAASFSTPGNAEFEPKKNQQTPSRGDLGWKINKS